VLFLGHLDVVEAKPEDWSVDPFELTEKVGWFYLIREARKLAEYPTPAEMRERLKGRAPYRGKIAASDLVRAERDSR
jgi:hypothetical protein